MEIEINASQLFIFFAFFKVSIFWVRCKNMQQTLLIHIPSGQPITIDLLTYQDLHTVFPLFIPMWIKWRSQSMDLTDPTEGTVQKFTFPDQVEEKVPEIGREKNECGDERMSSGAGRIDLHRQRGLQTPTSILGERFWSFGLGGKRSLWQSPVWFWWESVTNPSLHARTHAFSPSAWSTNSYRQSQVCYPPTPSFRALIRQRKQAGGAGGLGRGVSSPLH